jgi:hypothetical protein
MDDDEPFACDICGDGLSDEEARFMLVPPLRLIDKPLPRRQPGNPGLLIRKGYWLAALCPSCIERTKDQRLAMLGEKIVTVPGAEAQ